MPVSLLLGEVIADAAIAKLKAGIAARVAAINGQTTDFDIVAPPDDRIILGGFSSLPPGPAYIVAEGPTEIAGDTEGPHSFITETQLLIRVFDEDPDRQRLERKLARHRRAVIETLWDDDPKEKLNAASPAGAGTAVVYRISLLRLLPGPTSNPDDDRSHWRSYRDAVFLCEQLEG